MIVVALCGDMLPQHGWAACEDIFPMILYSEEPIDWSEHAPAVGNDNTEDTGDGDVRMQGMMDDDMLHDGGPSDAVGVHVGVPEGAAKSRPLCQLRSSPL